MEENEKLCMDNKDLNGKMVGLNGKIEQTEGIKRSEELKRVHLEQITKLNCDNFESRTRIVELENELKESNMKNEENETIIQQSELCKNKQIEELENKQMKTFEKQLNDIKSEMDEFEELNNKNNQEMEILKQENIDLKTKICEFETNKEIENERFGNNLNEIKTLKNELSVYENKIEQFEHEINNLKTENNEKEIEINKLKTESEECYNKLCKIRSEMNSKKEEILNLKHENTVFMEHRLPNLKEENEKINSDYFLCLKGVNNELTNTINNLTGNLKKTMSEFEKTAQESMTNCSKLKKYEEASKQKIEKLKY